MPPSVLEETIIAEILSNDRKSVVDQIGESKFFRKDECRSIFDAILACHHKSNILNFDNVMAEVRDLKGANEQYKESCLKKIKEIEKEVYFFDESQIDSLFDKYISSFIKDTVKKLSQFGDLYTPIDAARDMIAALSVIESTGKNLEGMSYERFKRDYVQLIEEGKLIEDPGIVLNKQVHRRIFGDLYPGYYIIAGRPSMGKTQIINNLIADLCCIPEMHGAYFSLENKKSVAAKSILAIETLIQHDRFKKNKMDKGSSELIRRTWRNEENLMIYDDKVSVEEVRRIVEKTKAKKNLKWIAIDYFQIMKRPGKRPEREEYDYMSSYLHRMFKELNIMIFLLSQVNDRNENKKSENISFQIGELKGTGSLEADADFILGIEGERKADEKTLHIAKHRWGPVNRVTVRFRKDIGVMTEIEAE